MLPLARGALWISAGQKLFRNGGRQASYCRGRERGLKCRIGIVSALAAQQIRKTGVIAVFPRCYRDADLEIIGRLAVPQPIPIATQRVVQLRDLAGQLMTHAFA